MNRDEYNVLFHKMQLNLVAFKRLMDCDEEVLALVNEAIREALAEQPAQQQEPVAWLVESKHGNFVPYLEWSEPSYLETQVVTPLYTSPTASKPWVGLTRDEVLDIEETTTHPLEFARAIEAKLKEKNT